MRRSAITRITSLALALLVIFPTAVSAAPGSVNATDVKFRAGPATSADILGRLAKGTSVDILKTEGDWVQVKIAEVTGFVFGQYITAEVPGAAPSTTGTSIVAEALIEVDANLLNIRAEATAESDKLGEITRGMEAALLGESGEWAKIRTASGVTGFVLRKWLVPVGASVSRGSGELVDELVSVAMSLRGIRYVYGGMSVKGFDCSGFVGYCYDSIGMELPRSSRDFSGVGAKVARSDMRAGDIILWDTDGGRRTNISHVGIYLGNDTFIHASTTLRKVVVASVSGYQAKFLGARRVLR